MEKLFNVFITDYIPTIYTTPMTLEYQQNNKKRKGHVLAERNGVVIILYNITKDVLVLVKQFRPSVYLQQLSKNDFVLGEEIDVEKYPAEKSLTLEFCAGLEDKCASSAQIAQEEIFEECGYDVPIHKLEKIANIANLSDTTGARSTFYYCEVTEDMRVDKGGGVEGENIELIEMNVNDVIKYAKQSYVCSPVNFLFGLEWFLYHKYNNNNKNNSIS